MYKYGLGQSWTEEALPELFEPQTPSWTEEALPELFGEVAPAEVVVVQKPGMLAGIDFMSPVGLGALGLVGGYFAGKGKRMKRRYAMVGAAVGALASFFMKK